ncbi:chromosome partitioning protein ParA (plasmid) [Borrelia turcica IST7]|uniref:Chromosome partitioning protein ParA n=1 Tax=Borrelia turcica IST7 TaxID=1104446 RepID=A0A386PP40_9SPIR|nr:ParA family protein [Borrelia turcica]AYE36982.1 chromosome partitioning protein ParA [Borrelia turcica IST7]
MDAKKVPKIISVASIKGGVGKSTTCLILAKLLAQKHRVLLIDMDTQASITSYYNKQLKEKDINVFYHNIHKVLNEQMLIDDSIVNIAPNIDIIPSYLSLQDFVEDFISNLVENYTIGNKEKMTYEDATLCLKNAMRFLPKEYDYILIDNPPSLDTILVNALLVSDYVIVPVVCELWTVESLALIKDKIRDRLKLNIPIYMMITKYKKRSTYEYLYNELAKRDDFLGTISERESLNRSVFSRIDFDIKYDYMNEYKSVLDNFMKRVESEF